MPTNKKLRQEIRKIQQGLNSPESRKLRQLAESIETQDVIDEVKEFGGKIKVQPDGTREVVFQGSNQGPTVRTTVEQARQKRRKADTKPATKSANRPKSKAKSARKPASKKRMNLSISVKRQKNK